MSSNRLAKVLAYIPKTGPRLKAVDPIEKAKPMVERLGWYQALLMEIKYYVVDLSLCRIGHKVTLDVSKVYIDNKVIPNQLVVALWCSRCGRDVARKHITTK